jgi:hypothetical protein
VAAEPRDSCWQGGPEKWGRQWAGLITHTLLTAFDLDAGDPVAPPAGVEVGLELERMHRESGAAVTGLKEFTGSGFAQFSAAFQWARALLCENTERRSHHATDAQTICRAPNERESRGKTERAWSGSARSLIRTRMINRSH